jgi:hypothetical protein
MRFLQSPTGSTGCQHVLVVDDRPLPCLPRCPISQLLMCSEAQFSKLIGLVRGIGMAMHRRNVANCGDVQANRDS